eukprot:7379041-Prymnesium_polylepis.1
MQRHREWHDTERHCVRQLGSGDRRRSKAAEQVVTVDPRGEPEVEGGDKVQQRDRGAKHEADDDELPRELQPERE